MKLPDNPEDAHEVIAYAANLASALSVVAHDVGQMQPDDPIGRERRDAIVGLADALERALRD